MTGSSLAVGGCVCLCVLGSPVEFVAWPTTRLVVACFKCHRLAIVDPRRWDAHVETLEIFRISTRLASFLPSGKNLDEGICRFVPPKQPSPRCFQDHYFYPDRRAWKWVGKREGWPGISGGAMNEWMRVDLSIPGLGLLCPSALSACPSLFAYFICQACLRAISASFGSDQSLYTSL